jgi:hypothetical protein
MAKTTVQADGALNVLPEPPLEDVVDCGASYFKAPCNGRLRQAPRRERSYLYNLRGAQFGARTFFPFGFHGKSNPLPAFFPHVLYVIFLSAQPKMLRFAARRIVAIVKDLNVWRNSPIVKNPRKVMGQNFACAATTFADHSITKLRVPSNPYPAITVERNLGPKTGDDGFGKSLSFKKLRPIVRPLDQVHFDCVTLPAIALARGLLPVQTTRCL